MSLTLGSLFDGIGGFPLAATRCGVDPRWASEIEPFPVEVTTHHFPTMKHLGDVTAIRGDQVEPVDIITFGSPCQDLSVAGKREGLDGARSGLFYEAIRIIDEMRRETSGRHPRIALWENVPGALSSNKGEDFRAVIEAFVNLVEPSAQVPVPRSGRWATAGMVRGGGWSLSWRVLDAQHFGVPQRRRRIFVIVDFGSERADEILFERQGVSGNSSTGDEARKGAAVDTASGAGGDGFPRVSGTLLASGAGLNRPAGCASEVDLLVPVAAAHPYEDIAKCVTAGTGKRYDYDTETLGPTSQVVAVDVRNLRETDVAGTLQAKSSGGYSLNYINPVRVEHRVRRLTPRECERLQGFPDDWTAGGSDSKRYKALGNSVAVPVVEWIMRRIVTTMEVE